MLLNYKQSYPSKTVKNKYVHWWNVKVIKTATETCQLTHYLCRFQRFASFVVIITMSWCYVMVLRMTRLGGTFCALRCHVVNVLDEALFGGIWGSCNCHFGLSDPENTVFIAEFTFFNVNVVDLKSNYDGDGNVKCVRRTVVLTTRRRKTSVSYRRPTIPFEYVASGAQTSQGLGLWTVWTVCGTHTMVEELTVGRTAWS